ncbi:M20/M25/M40 family metallo-hydrolase [Rufibacter quisquiliarum]|uniref:Zn-dependent M28 family amino/carboxypeptidase n=1 Tax=Rufibacter quisquiliarum TaxID=1549639 RepID=A0A839GGK6_9BACT|nr:M20/M25/M40 family metallo-hydrolase [Rufibacter quisquiliarum]MBA9076723.1 Zn-dependent M28 family amino/carboxypeptidase [Rufibacter quisquiliarum]
MKKTVALPRSLAALVAVCSLCLGSCAQSSYQPAPVPQVLKDVEILAADSMEGRLPNTPGHAKAQQYLLKRFQQVGLQPVGGQYQHTFTFSPRGSSVTVPGVNLVGVRTGSSPKKIVVTAHYDHVGTRNGQIYNGADDDASGIGAILALAEHFKNEKPKHTLVFVAFDAEEQGLVGSKAFVSNLPFPKEDILLNVNLDMVSISDKNELYASGTYHYPWIRQLVEQVKLPEQFRLSFGHDRPEQGHDDWTLQSDHGSFHQAQIPFLYFGVEDHPHYHKESDEFQNIHQSFYLKAVEVILKAVQVLDEKLPE